MKNKTDTETKIKELIEIAKAATHGTCTYEKPKDECEKGYQASNPLVLIEGCVGNPKYYFESDAKFATTFNPAFVLKLLESLQTLRFMLVVDREYYEAKPHKALEMISQLERAKATLEKVFE